MLNYIALLFLGWIILQGGVKDPAQARRDQQASALVGDAAAPARLLATATNFGLILGLLAALVVAWLINRSTFGFEVRAVGANPDAARTAGMSVAKTYILVMIVAGALAGLGGAVQLLGTASRVDRRRRREHRLRRHHGRAAGPGQAVGRRPRRAAVRRALRRRQPDAEQRRRRRSTSSWCCRH